MFRLVSTSSHLESSASSKFIVPNLLPITNSCLDFLPATCAGSKSGFKHLETLHEWMSSDLSSFGGIDRLGQSASRDGTCARLVHTGVEFVSLIVCFELDQSNQISMPRSRFQIFNRSYMSRENLKVSGKSTQHNRL